MSPDRGPKLSVVIPLFNIERARVAGFAGLVVSIDTPVSGIRDLDYRNGMKELFHFFRKYSHVHVGSSAFY